MTWENHFRREMAGVHTWPVFDLRLVVTMARAGYEHIKMSFGVDGDAFGDAMPEAIEDCFTQTKGWRSVLQFVHDGVRCRETSWVTDYAKAPGYFDFTMRLRDVPSRRLMSPHTSPDDAGTPPPARRKPDS